MYKINIIFIYFLICIAFVYGNKKNDTDHQEFSAESPLVECFDYEKYGNLNFTAIHEKVRENGFAIPKLSPRYCNKHPLITITMPYGSTNETFIFFNDDCRILTVRCKESGEPLSTYHYGEYFESGVKTACDMINKCKALRPTDDTNAFDTMTIGTNIVLIVLFSLLLQLL